MKNKICLFAGTTEGHRLARFLGGQNVQVTISVATEYGAQVMEPFENEKILHGKLPVEEIICLLEQEHFDLVIDATHPYASSITGSISHACAQAHTEYLRLRRALSDVPQDACMVADAREAVRFLDQTSGNVFFTTGSKELAVYKDIADFAGRAYVRVLPLASSLEACTAAGLCASHIIAMQGPFTADLNAAMLKSTDAAWLVTKETSDEGGFAAKVQACREAGVRMLVIGRPEDTEGEDYAGVIRILCSRFGCISRPHIAVVGIGPGNREMMTDAAVQAISRADCLIGAKRMIESAQCITGRIQSKPFCEAVAPEKIAQFIERNPQYQDIAVLMSGDTGFYSGTRKLLSFLPDQDTEVIPGISSLSFLCSRLHVSYEDVYTASLHGRQVNIAALVKRNRKVFTLTGGENDAASVCKTLTMADLGNVKVSIGQRLGYPDEQIVSGPAWELADQKFDPLSAMLMENEQADCIYTPGLPDERFERGGEDGRIVPMTKSEIRALCMSKLGVGKDSVCWDVGAGTGSVSIEMSLAAPEGRVYAVEKRADAIQLLEKNKQKFCAYNITIVEGTAPEALDTLPAPTHVFIGGSSGNIGDIIRTAVNKNSSVTIVATAVSLEAVSDLTSCMNRFYGMQTSVTMAGISRDKQAGNYHLMNALNPVYIFEFKFSGDGS